MKKHRIRILAALILLLALLAGFMLYADLQCREIPGRTFVQRVCLHGWQDGVCTRCGLVCPHFWEDGICTVCGMICSHQWQKGSCTVCGRVCSHEWSDGACSICGLPCSHEWQDGVCTVCGVTCGHEWAEGTCSICGLVCGHEWENGVCTICGLPCTHEEHDKTTGLCTECGLKVPHRYRDEVCTRCGADLVFADDSLPEELIAYADREGTVTEVSYVTHDYRYERDTGEERLLDKTYLAYLPYDYDPGQKYNVLVLVHGGGGSAADWLTTERYVLGKGITGAALLDQMIENKYCDPLIVISITTVSDLAEFGLDEYLDNAQLEPEWENDILPSVVSNFSTWAASPDFADICAAREHFGVAGLSNGAIATLETGIECCTECFAWFGAYSGDGPAADEVVAALNSDAYQDLTVSYFFTSAGEYDHQRKNVETGYDTILDGCSQITEDNSGIVIVSQASHDWRTWLISLYDSLLVFFN